MVNKLANLFKKAGCPAFFVISIILLLCPSSSKSQFLAPKFHLSGLALYQPGLALEYVIDRQFSFQLNGFYRPPVSNENWVIRSFEHDGSTNNSLSGYNVSLEARAYTRRSRNAETKIYSGFFVRYYEYKLESNFNRNSVQYQLQGQLQNISAGLETGVNWIFNKKISVDLTFVAAGFASNQLQGTLIPSDMQAPIGALEDDMQGIPVIGNRIILERDNTEQLFRFTNDYKTLALRSALSVGLIF